MINRRDKNTVIDILLKEFTKEYGLGCNEIISITSTCMQDGESMFIDFLVKKYLTNEEI